MQLMGKDTEPMLNLPEKIERPNCFTMSLKAFLYLPITAASSRGNPPSLWAKGCLKSSFKSSIGLSTEMPS